MTEEVQVTQIPAEEETVPKRPGVLDGTGKLILPGLVILILMVIASAYVGLVAFIGGMVAFGIFWALAFFKERKEPVDREHCLSCGRPIAGKQKCGVCGANQSTRVTEMQLISVACALLLISMAYLGAASHYSETKISKVGFLQESDNFRQIRVVGKVVDMVDYYPEKYEDTGTIRMLVNDGTGDIFVRIVPGVAQHFIESGEIPGFGDTVDAEGSLFVGDDGYMQVKVRDKNLFAIVSEEPQQVDLPTLARSTKSDFQVGDKINVEGQIQGKFEIEGFAWILDLGDDAGHQVSVFIPDSVTALTGDLDLKEVYLSRVRVTGGLEWYEDGDAWEIIPSSIDDIVVLSRYTGDTYVKLTVSQFLANTSAYNNQYVQIDNATVAWRYADYLFSVRDSGSSYQEVSVFVDYDSNASVGFKVGDSMNVRGWVTFYDENNNELPDEGEWEIKVRALSSDYALTGEDMDAGGGY